MLSVQYVQGRDGKADSVKIFIGSKFLTFMGDHPNVLQVVEEHKAGTLTAERAAELHVIKVKEPEPEHQDFLDLVDYAEQLGVAAWRDGALYFNDVPFMHKAITEKVLGFAKNGYPIDPILRFIEKLMLNPSPNSRMELFEFLAEHDLPFTEDGDFLAYKAVGPAFLDKWSSTIDNHPGAKPSMPREDVCADKHQACGPGLHLGDQSYAAGYGRTGDHMIVVKVHPRDVVSVPTDDGCRKCRTCGYEVIGEYEGDLPANLYDFRKPLTEQAELPLSTKPVLDLSYLDTASPCCDHDDEDDYESDEDSGDEDSWDSEEDSWEDVDDDIEEGNENVDFYISEDGIVTHDFGNGDLPSDLVNRLQNVVEQWNREHGA